MKEKVLLHVCCAPCSTNCIDELRDEGYEPIIYFYNPNIHPEEEYKRRLDDIKGYCDAVNCELIVGEGGQDQWEERTQGLEDEPEGGARCDVCFEMRLEKAADTSKTKGCLFTTSLTVSPYKNSRKIFEIAERVSKSTGSSFLEIDFKKKDGYMKSVRLSKENNLYRQKYCGCRYSIRK